MDIGDRVRAARKSAGLTQEQLARRTKLTLKAVGELERAEVRDPHYSTLSGIADALGMTIAELVGEKEPVPLSVGPSGPGRSPNEPDDLADLLRRLGSPTQYLADPELFRALEGMGDEEFYATTRNLDKELEVLAGELERRQAAAVPGPPSEMTVSLLWEKIARLFIALRMLRRAREGVEPQRVEPQRQRVKEVADIARDIGELVGASA